MFFNAKTKLYHKAHVALLLNIFKLVYFLTIKFLFLKPALNDFGGKCCVEFQHCSIAFQGFLVVSVFSGDKHTLHHYREKPGVFIMYMHYTFQSKCAGMDNMPGNSLTHQFKGSPGEKEFPMKQPRKQEVVYKQ